MEKTTSPFLVFLALASLFFHPSLKADSNASSQQAGFSVEHSTWAEDWTDNLDTDVSPFYFISNLPKGVNTIHVFVGQFAYVNGVATINGYTADTPNNQELNPNFEFYKTYLESLGENTDDIADMESLLRKAALKKGKYGDLPLGRIYAPTKSGAPAGSGSFPNMEALIDFVKQSKAKGAIVKLSVGGQPGTTFGNSWQVLTDDNINDFAQALVNICQQTTADGIDFDQELEDTTIAQRAGKLAGAFKDKLPNASTSYCVYGGCDANGPWHETNKVFLQYAVTSQNWCAIDRVYVMTYYDGCSLSQNEGFMTSWNTWLGAQHGFTASRISAGVDPNDPTTSPNDGSLNTWIDFAAGNQFGTAIWDNLGVENYVTHNWGPTIENIYSTYNNWLPWLEREGWSWYSWGKRETRKAWSSL
ncbi:MAG: hypothetical protein K2W99_00005 [Chthoniobacterales bacterium]|nr:hypothetical protein [Chthoniobacterales bacterium]